MPCCHVAVPKCHIAFAAIVMVCGSTLLLSAGHWPVEPDSPEACFSNKVTASVHILPAMQALLPAMLNGPGLTPRRPGQSQSDTSGILADSSVDSSSAPVSFCDQLQPAICTIGPVNSWTAKPSADASNQPVNCICTMASAFDKYLQLPSNTRPHYHYMAHNISNFGHTCSSQ